MSCGASYKVADVNGYCSGFQVTGPIGVTREECWKHCKKDQGFQYAEYNRGTCWCHESCPSIIEYRDFSPAKVYSLQPLL